jgi:alpha-maltose-1-phosphate synthase
MKVLYVIPYDWGGLPHYTSELANAASKYEDVVVLASSGVKMDYFSKDVKVIKAFEKLNFSLKDLGKAFSPSSLSRFLSFKEIKVIDEIKPDLIHFTTPLIPMIPVFMKLYGLGSRYPVVQTKHHLKLLSGLCLESFSEIVVNLFEKLIPFQRIIVHTRSDKNEMISRGISREEDVTVIPHGIYDLFKDRGGRSDQADAGPEEKCVLFFGYIKKYKGLEYLLRAAPMISSEVKDARIIIAGEGDLSPYQDLIKDCDSSKLEIYNRYLSDEEVSALFQRATVVVLPYTCMSGESGVLNIAYAFEKPVVSSSAAGFGEVMEDGATGYLVPPKDYLSLGNATIKILKDDGLRAEMRMAIRRKRQELSWDAIAKKHIDVYRSMVTSYNQKPGVAYGKHTGEGWMGLGRLLSYVVNGKSQ